MPNSQLKAALQAMAEQGAGSIAAPDSKPQVHWHIEGDTVHFYLTPEACYHLGIQTGPTQ